VNDPAYLYIVMKGSSGNWRVLFPSPEYDSGANRVLPGRDYDIPSRTRFVFDETPGEEKLFFVLSRQAESDLDRLIYELDQPAAPAARPASSPAKTQPVKTMMAMNAINVSDDLVGRLRGKVIARDLVFEKVDEKTARQPGWRAGEGKSHLRGQPGHGRGLAPRGRHVAEAPLGKGDPRWTLRRLWPFFLCSCPKRRSRHGRRRRDGS